MPVISIRVSDEWLAAVDREMQVRLWSRNAAVVNLVWIALADKGKSVLTVTSPQVDIPSLEGSRMVGNTIILRDKEKRDGPVPVPTAARRQGRSLVQVQPGPPKNCPSCGGLNGMHQRNCKGVS
jgi:hypothetical protein